MKKSFKSILYFILSAIMVIAFTACSSPEEGIVSPPKEEIISGEFTLEKDFGVTVNGKWFPIHSDVSGLLNELGDDYELAEWASCAFVGQDKSFEYSDYDILTNPDGAKDIWYLISLHTDKLSTARGIKVGDSEEKVKEAYGDKFYWDDELTLVYSISGQEGDSSSPNIQFTIEDGEVIQIDMDYPTGK